MPVLFHTTNGDTGAADAPSVQPLVGGVDIIGPTATNRPTENLRIRTEILKQKLEVTELSLAAPILALAERTDGAVLDVFWDGPYDPAGSSVPAAGTAGSGTFYIGSSSANVDARLTLYPANTAATRYASVRVTDQGGNDLTFTTSAKAAQGGNSMRVRVVRTIGTGVNPAASVSWTHKNTALATQPVPAPGETPAAPSASEDTLVLAVRTDGTTLISDIKTALSGTPSPAGYTYTLTSSKANSTTIAFATDTGYYRLAGGIDNVAWYLSATELMGFFNSGLISTSLTAGVTANANAQAVTVGSVGGIVAGQTLDVGSTAGADYESVTVVSVNAGASQFTAVFTKNHLTATPVKAAPNRLRSGDTLLVMLGDGKARLSRNANLLAADLALPRSSSIQQDTPVFPVGSCPAGSQWLLYGGDIIEKQSSLYYAKALYVRLGGDLLGVGSTVDAPRVVWGAVGRPGLVAVSSTPSESGPVVPLADATGKVLAPGITAPAAGTTLALGTGVNDAGVNVSKAGAPTNVKGTLVVDQAAQFKAPATFDTTTTFKGVPDFQTQVTFGQKTTHNIGADVRGALALTDTVTQTIGKAVGDIRVGTTDPGGTGSVYLVSKDSNRWQLDANGNLRRVAGNTGTITALPDPVNDSDAAHKKYVTDADTALDSNLRTYVDGFAGRAHTWTGSQVFSVLPKSSVSPADPDDFVNKAYADAVAGAGWSWQAFTVQNSWVNGTRGPEFSKPMAGSTRLVLRGIIVAPATGTIDPVLGYFSTGGFGGSWTGNKTVYATAVAVNPTDDNIFAPIGIVITPTNYMRISTESVASVAYGTKIVLDSITIYL